MAQDLVTIVVPIYNVEKYLNRCLNSIVNQTYTNLEIILVDDGSPDNCPAMCDEWAKKDSRIKVIHKKNAGLGMARNTGIEHATGEYICFFDSDDYIALDLVEKVHACITKYDADTVIYGMCLVDENGKLLSSTVPTTEKDYYSGNEIMRIILPAMIGGVSPDGKRLNLNMSSSGQMYSMQLIRRCQWRYVSERTYISEDVYSLYVLYHYVQSVAVLHEAFYYYCRNPASLTQKFDPERYKKNCFLYQSLMQLCDEYKDSDYVRKSLASPCYGNMIGAMKSIVRSSLTDAEKKRQIGEIVNDTCFQDILKTKKVQHEKWHIRLFILCARMKITTLVYWMIRAAS